MLSPLAIKKLSYFLIRIENSMGIYFVSMPIVPNVKWRVLSVDVVLNKLIKNRRFTSYNRSQAISI